MGSIGCVRCENIRRDFVALTFALIAPVRPILHRVYCRNKMFPNAPKHYETHHNMSLGSDAVDWADLLQRILLQLCGLNFCFNCNSSAWIEPSIVKQRNGPKCTQTLRNKTKHDFRFQWGVDQLHSLRKIWKQLRGMNFCINCTSSAHFEPSFMQ